LNQDGDEGGRITIGDITNQINPEGTPKLVFVDTPTVATAGGALNLNDLSLSSEVEVQFSDVRFDATAGQYTATLRLHNTSDSDLGRNVAVLFGNLPSGISLTNASGADANGDSYINFRNAIQAGGLTAGSLSDGVEISFSNPNQLRLALQSQVYVGGPNQAPVLDPLGPLSVMPGHSLEIPLAATDPDGDTVTYSIRSDGDLPLGRLQGNKLVFEPSPDQVGSYAFTLVASDGALETTQSVTLDVVADPDTTTRISGRVLDTEGNPLANLPIELGRLQTVTDAQGYFSLTIADTSFPSEELDIAIPLGDPAFDPLSMGDQVIDLRRTTADNTTGTDASNPLRHPNLVSAFMDGSMIYGNSTAIATALRTNDGTGQLQVSANGLLPLNNSSFFPDGPLPNVNRSQTDPATLFATGDVRANENIGLTALHTVFVKEHNRLAAEMASDDPSLSGEAIYQRARKQVTAQLQHITYSEYLPLLLGEGTISSYQGYDPTVDSSISHLFAAAAFRLGHTQGFDEFLLVEGGNTTALSLGESTFAPDVLQQHGIDPILRGLYAQSAQAIDLQVIDELRNTLFGPPGAGGIDLAAVDIERGRDLGLPDYNQARIDFGLAPVTSFADITSDIAVQAALEQLYGSVDNIDVIVGGLAEDKAPGAMVGSLFQRVLADQFARLRDGDRLWYENGQFTATELNKIRTTTLSGLITRNTSISDLPGYLFSKDSDIPNAPAAAGTVAAAPVTDYASIDGSGHNLDQPDLGQAGSVMRVDYTQEYGNGIRTPGGSDRPNSREISNAIFAQAGDQPDPFEATGMMVAWSQFMGHDLSFTPAGAADTLKFYGTQYNGGDFPFVAEKLELVLGHGVYRGVDNVIERPIYLPALDPVSAHQYVIDTQGTTTVTNDALGASVEVAADSLIDQAGQPFAGQLTISEVPPELTPAALPEGLSPDLVVTIQPGEMAFTQPAPLSLPNEAGWAPGMEMDLWSINPITGEFEIVGTGKVSDDGTTINTIDGGIRNSSWHFFATPPGDYDINQSNNRGNTCSPTGHGVNGAAGALGGAANAATNAAAEALENFSGAAANFSSQVDLQTGAVIETHNLVSYQSQGQQRGIQLVYDSLRADARPIAQASFGDVDPNALLPGATDRLRLIAEMTIDINGVDYTVPGYGGGLGLDGGEHFWRLPEQAGPVSGSLQADLRDVESGVYSFDLSAGIYLNSLNRRFVGSSTTQQGQLVHVNTVNSAFGSGWGIAGLQHIVENADGSLLLIDGDGTELLFDAPASSGASYQSPVGDFTTFERLTDGTFRRTTKDQTVYTFDSKNRLASVVDRNGNTTQHEYNAADQLEKIIDPVGLETTFTYNGSGKVEKITDPAGRITEFKYDTAGNLTQIIDPDASQRIFDYDAEHHMTGETDQRGHREQAFYDAFGRATQAVQKDGSVVQVNPALVQGLYRPEETASPDGNAVAFSGDPAVATYADGNGDVTNTTVDGGGQRVTAADNEGQTQFVGRDSNNLITTLLDGRSNLTQFTYDELGNLTKIQDTLSDSTSDPRALRFDGTGDALVLAPEALALGGSSSATVELWVNLDDVNPLQTLYSEANANDDQLKLDVENGVLTFGVQTSQGWEYTGTSLVIPDRVFTGTASQPDLVVTDIVVPDDPSTWGESITVDWTVTNQGTVSTRENWWDAIYVSSDTILDAGDQLLRDTFISLPPLAPGESYTRSTSISTNGISRDTPLYVLVNADYTDRQSEVNENNNVGIGAALNLTNPDLVVTDIVVPDDPSTWGESITVDWTVTNQGTVSTRENWWDAIYVSSDTILDAGDQLLRDTFISLPPLAPGESYTRSTSISTNGISRDTPLYVLVNADYTDRQSEVNENNNVGIGAALNLTNPDLVVTDIVVPDDPSTWGESITVDWTVTNQGTVSTRENWWDAIYVSSDTILDAGDQLLRDTFISLPPLAPGESYTRSTSISTNGISRDTPLYVLVNADYTDRQSEVNENNNVGIGAALNLTNPDLVVTDIVVPDDPSTWGESITVDWTVTNQGTVSTRENWWDAIYVSSDTILDAGDQLLRDTFISLPPLAPGESYTRSTSISTNGISRDTPLYVLVNADYTDRQSEVNENNNVGIGAALNLTNPDLVVTDIVVPDDPSTWGESITVDWTVTNQGTVSTRENWWDAIYVSSDTILDAGDQLLRDTFISLPPLAPGESYTRSTSISTNGISRDTPLYVLVNADYTDRQSEVNENNNVLAAGTSLSVSGSADLVVTAVDVPDGVALGETTQVSWTVENQGDAPATGYWSDGVFLSADTQLDSADQLLHMRSASGQRLLEPGESYTFAADIIVPDDGLTQPYLLFATDYWNNRQIESNDANNTYALAHTLTAPDLAITNGELLTANATWGDTVDLSWTVTNQSSVSTVSNWSDYIYASEDAVLDPTDVLVHQYAAPMALAAGESYTANHSLTIPQWVTGKPYLLLATDGGRQQLETNDNNNLLTLATLSVPPPISGSADLVVTAVDVPDGVALGETTQVSWTVENQGDAPATGYWSDGVFLSADTQLDSADQLLHMRSASGQRLLEPGESYTFAADIIVPDDGLTQPYLLFATDYWNNRQIESNDANNTYALAHTLTAPDLAITNGELLTANATWGDTVDLSWTVTNQSSVSTVSNWSDYIYASEDAVLDPTDVLVHQYAAPMALAAGESYTANHSLTIPQWVTGKPYLLLATDGGRQQLETNDNNNILALEALGAPDLTVTSFTAPSSSSWQSTIPLSWSVTNQSNYAAKGSWYDYIYASDDVVFDADDTVVAQIAVDNATPLAAGASYQTNYDLALPDIAAGKPYLFVVSDGAKTLFESADTNNARLLDIEDAATGRWIHVAAVMDDQSGLQLYVDGALRSNRALIGDLPTQIRGGSSQISDTSHTVDGLLDEVRVWNQVRTETEINADWRTALTGDEDGLVAYWSFDGKGTDIIDQTGQYAPTTLSGDVIKTQNVAPVLGQATETSGQRFTYDADFSQLLSSTDELGRQVLYDLDAEGNRVLMTQVVGELDSDQNGETDDVVTAYTYTDAGLIDTVTDGLGRITDYDYNPLGQIEQITFAMGSSDDEAQQTFEYDAAGNVSALIDENGHRTEYIYDDRNRVTQITEADPDGAGPLTSPVTQFTYDAAGNLETLTDARGHETRYTYDEKHRLIEVLDAEGNRSQYGYDQAGNMVSMVDGLGHETRYEYDSRNRRTAAIDAEGNRTEFRYDLDNNLAAIVDALGNETRFSYDARNRLISETDALDQVAIYEYDAANNLIAVTNRRDHTTQYSYDDLNRLTEVLDALNGTTHLGYDKVGNLTSTTDKRNHTTSYGYDDRDRLEQITDARNGTVSYTYDGVGNQLSITDQLNRTTSFDYDALNRLTQITDPLTHSTGFGYDANGNLTTVTDALDRVTTYDYDRLNRQVSMVNALGDSTTTTYDAVGNVTAFTDELNRTTTFGYDDRNLLTQITDPLGHSTTRGYDAVGNLKTLTDALNHTTQYDYDDLYRRTQVIDPTNRETVMTYDEMGNLLSLTDAANNVTTYSYDELDRLATETITVDSTDLTRTYGYDAASNLTSLIDRNGREHSYDYDELNRQTQEEWLDDQANLLRTISFGYDAASQLTSASDPDSTYTYTYDLAGHLETVDNTGTPGVPAVVLIYGYDEVNNLTSVTDTLNGTPAGTETFSYDDLNRVTQITQSGNGVADKRVNMTYDAASQLKELNRYSDLDGNLLVADTTYDYDLAGRLTDLTHGPAANPIADYGFSYDDANRLTQLVTPDGTSDYTYNDRDELTEADHTAQADEAYDYDATGNRTDHTTGDHNRLQSDGTYDYQYDSEGNRTRRENIATGEVTEYTWDHRNRLTAVVTKDSGGAITKQVDYTYDVYDRRITKTVDADGVGAGTATEEHFVYDGEHISLVFDETGTQTQRYLHGPQIDQVLAEETAAGDTQWALTDHQGSVRDVIDNSGAVLNHLVYDSFGQVTSESDPTVDFRFGYTGRELDAETDLMYYRARYFDPAAGTFVSEDPLGFGAGDENLYRYVFNSPTNFTDPSGQAFVLVAPGLLVPIAIAVGVTTVSVAGYNIYTGLQSIDESRSGVSPEEFDPNYGARDRTVPDLGPIDRPHDFPLLGDEWSQWPHGIPQGPVCEIPDHGLFPSPRPDYSDFERPYFTSGSPDEIHQGQQGKHIPGHPNFEPARGRSELTHPNPQSLLDQYSGTGQPIGGIPVGQPGSKERVDFGQPIGIHSDQQTNTRTPTSKGIIHYGKNGAHIVPSRP
jgi:RHS repeat-associated protein